jgi:3-deoxy-D-manno-octulosonate 8-phosphate phosphatase (KDO 8-P phosphatase)
MDNYKQRLGIIKVFIFDVDGVLTNGDVYMIDDQLVRVFNSRDAYAIQYAIKNGYKVFVITGGRNKAVKERLEDLGVTEVRMQASNKIKVYDELREQYGFSDAQVLYMGDDIPDHQVMEVVFAM